MPPTAPGSPTERLTATLAAELAAEEAALDPVDFEELAAAAEGAQDEGARALWQERIAREPSLALRAEALTTFRREAWPDRALQLAPPRRPRATWRWAAGIAAATLVAVLAVGRHPLRAPAQPVAPPVAAESAATPAAPAPAREIFADGFESGDASRWFTSPAG